MSRIAGIVAASGGKGAYEIEQSLMFNDGDSPYLTRTPSSAGNLRTWTLSFWVKRSTLGVFQIMYSASNSGSGATDYGIIYFDSSDRLGFYYDTSTIALTNKKFRDVGAWYHIYIFLDTTASSTGDRWGIYINGVNQTSWSEYNHPSQNTDIAWNNNIPHYIGRTHGGYYFDGYIAEFHNIDGTVKPHTDFGETDSETGQWIPKKYGGGSYGTTGFYLKFVSGALGTDSSGSSNTWTANNLANADVMLDTPTTNFCTWNPLDNGSTVLSQGSLKFVNSSGNSDTGNTFAIPHTGKWYFEHRLTVVDAYYAGLASKGYTGTAGSYSGFTVYQIRHDGQWWNGDAFESYASSFSNGDILGWAIDCDNGKIYVSVNGTFANSGNPVNGTNPADTFTATADWKFITYGNSGSQFDANFGQNGTFNGLVTAQGNADGEGIGNFYYAPPSGFKALCTKNLPAPAVKKSTDHFNTVLYTGDGSATRSITGAGFQPNFTWLKGRTEAYSHLLYDAVRGAGASKALKSNSSVAEGENDNATYGYLSAFTSDGFNLVHGSSSSSFTNENNDNMVSWNWKAGGSGSANNSGDINATVSANPTAGFSIVSWTGDGSNGNTIAHGLGKEPSVIFYKDRSTSSLIYVVTTAIDGSQDYLALGSNTLAAASSYGAPTSSTISNWTFGANSIIAYCFAEVEGFSKFGSYTGNGEAEDGPYVITGFSPAFVIQKETSEAGGSWFMWDNKREVGNVKDAVVWADYAGVETSHAEYEIDFLSNGFKIRGNSGGTNSSGQTNLYMAWAESPFKYANAR